MEKTVNIKINGISASVPSDYTILEAAKSLGIKIPRLCFLKGVNENSSCRVCVVEIKGLRTLKNSCSVKVTEGMEVQTNTPRIRKAVKATLELLAANHHFQCWKCSREHNCEFINLLRSYNINNEIYINQDFSKKEDYINNQSAAIVIDTSKCVLCGRCIGACRKYTGHGVLDYNFRGFKTFVGPALNHDMEDAGCIYCGKCIQACPTGALSEKEQIDEVDETLFAKDKFVVAEVAPAVRTAIGEEFGLPVGTNVEGQLFRALKDLGFDDITDTSFAADLTVTEEGDEFLKRLTAHLDGKEAVLPMFTSCSPGWIRYIEEYYPKYLANLSTVKSPQQIQGALIKHYYAQKLGIDKEKIHIVSIMPCIAKKFEARKPEMVTDGVCDVDNVLTTRELARLIKRHGISLNSLAPYTPDSPLATYTGAGVIFGATGGVMEAVIRSVYGIMENKELQPLDFKTVRGVEDGIKEATVRIKGMDINVAVVHGAVNMSEMMKRIESGVKQYHFIEVMGCTGGCVNGGGQPIVSAADQETLDVRKLRANTLYSIDQERKIRNARENPIVNKIYEEFLGSPNSEKAHHLLHTHYMERKIYFNIK